jgi:hypothetical protein
MCPESWKDQYDLTQDLLPQSVRKILGVLENIEKVVASSNAKEKAMKESTEKVIRKKAKVEKSCKLCQKYRGAHTTRNTGECRKYKKDRTLKNGFHKKVIVGQKCYGNGKKDHATSFVNFMERFSKLEKAVKKTQKSS